MSTIIAGKYKGRNIRIRNLKNVRPTLARIKKSIFQILEPIENKNVLDLYSGTGSIGLEFLSRGASTVTMVERSRKLVSILHKNISKIHLDNNYTIICNDAIRFLNNNSNKYDIIFADPPYDTIEYLELKKKINSLLHNGGVFCMEMKKNKLFDNSIDIRVYGNSQVAIWKK
tara:strand:+ start:15 stop:530 length:516 start_codon:yes stop_codon:yes gene_type:complete